MVYVRNLKIQGTKKHVEAIRTDYEIFGDGKWDTVWSGQDGKAYECRTIRGKKCFVPFTSYAA